MIPKGLFTQIGMVIISIAIVVTYIQPAFSEIGEVQDSIKVYQSELEQVRAVNSLLDSLVDRMESVPNDDRNKLSVYLPDKIDEIAVQRDIYLITNSSGALYKGVSYGGEVNENRNKKTDQSANLPSTHIFSLTAEGTYDQIKSLFSQLEQNHYPLEVRSVSIQQIGDSNGFLSVSVELATYTFKEAEETPNQVIF